MSTHRVPEVGSSTVKVLFAEDEVFLRLMVSDALREEGFEVVEAVNAKEAITILENTPVDIVVTDLHMRTAEDGMQVANYVRSHCPGVSVALASALLPPIVENPLFHGFFLKPYDPKDIANWIRRRPVPRPDAGCVNGS